MKQLKELRIKQGYSRKQMAQLLGVSLSQYDKVEFNQRPASRTFLKKFKDTFPDFDMNIFFDSFNYKKI